MPPPDGAEMRGWVWYLVGVWRHRVHEVRRSTRWVAVNAGKPRSYERRQYIAQEGWRQHVAREQKHRSMSDVIVNTLMFTLMIAVVAVALAFILY